MTNPIGRLATGAAYGATQLPRMAWYIGHGLAMRQLSRVARRQGSDRPRPGTSKPVPDRFRLFADMAALLRTDVANVQAGLYPMPDDLDGSLLDRLNRSLLFFTDLPVVYRRRERGMTNDVATAAALATRPRYYLQNFHFQSGGWLTDDSARRYDTQVEVFFSGTANAMRRQALPPLRDIFAGRDPAVLKLIDIGCGTGRFLASVRQTWPKLQVTGLDLSEAYIREARAQLGRGPGFMVANGESIPVADASVDAATSIFVFHELPPKARRAIFREVGRILKPGGRAVIVDSLQSGDNPAYEGTLELFPQNYHEPYFSTYIREDFRQLARDNGLVHRRDVPAFVSKVMVFDKPA
jgi:ubiquinone/menaquinone biosynthesis C-methylase UbiE